jgi:hypothetical protein
LITEGDLYPNMSAEIVPPKERTCEKCGRTDVWDAEAENWVIAEENGERQVGNRHCIHEWDINGQYNPVAGKADVGADDTDADADA